MSFFAHVERNRSPVAGKARPKVTADFFAKNECKACPLNRDKTPRSPKMEPLGRSDALIYALGAAPFYAADKQDKPFAGDALRLIRRGLTRGAIDEVRFNNTIRCFPGEGKRVETKDPKLEVYSLRELKFGEVESCRPSIVRDIERTQPKAIFTFGSEPLRWIAGETHPHNWQGRRFPARIGSHVCWVYPFVDANFLLRERRWEGHEGDNEIAFNFYLERASAEVLSGKLPTPVIHSEEYVRRNLLLIDGSGGSSDIRAVESFFNRAVQRKYVGHDLETNGLRPYNKDKHILTSGFATSDEAMAYVLHHKEGKFTKGEIRRLEDMTAEFISDPRPRKAVHNLAFELEWHAVKTAEHALHGSKWDCTLAQAYVINETQGMLSLETLCRQYFGFDIKGLSNVNRKNLANEPLAKILPYNAIDARYHLELCFVQEDILQDESLLDVYEHTIERIPSLVLTTVQGVPINQHELSEFKKKYVNEIEEAEEIIASHPTVQKWEKRAGERFDPGNTHQFASLLKSIGIKLEKTEKGGDATDVKHINKHATKHEIIKLIWKWRKPTKLMSTYVNPVTTGSEHIFDDGRTHPIISTTKVETWRTSSDSPNIQNWPKRNDYAEIRRVVDGGSDYRIVSFDYAGIQGRNVAMESRDKVLTQAFIDGYDIHSDWLIRWEKHCPEWFPKGWHKDGDIKKKLRHGMKNQFVFPSFFGAAPSETMCGNLQETGLVRPKPVQCEAMQEEFFGMFSGVHGWHSQIHKDYRRNGYVTGLSGFRRHAPVTHNQIINSPIQADESKIVLSAHVALSQLDQKWGLSKYGSRYQPMMEIHDDLSFLWHKDDVDHYAETVLEEMTRIRFDWINPLPLEVEMSIGTNWFNVKEVGVFKNKYDDGRAGIIQLKGEPRFV